MIELILFLVLLTSIALLIHKIYSHIEDHSLHHQSTTKEARFIELTKADDGHPIILKPQHIRAIKGKDKHTTVMVQYNDNTVAEYPVTETPAEIMLFMGHTWCPIKQESKEKTMALMGAAYRKSRREQENEEKEKSNGN